MLWIEELEASHSRVAEAGRAVAARNGARHGREGGGKTLRCVFCAVEQGTTAKVVEGP